MAATRVARKITKRTLSPTLPHFLKVGKEKVSIIASVLEESQCDRVHELYLQAAEAGDGYSKSEVEKEYLKNRLMNESMTLTFTDEKSGEIVGVGPISDSPLTRSTKALVAVMWTVVDPRFRGQGLVREIYKLGFPVTTDMGYLGMNGRVALTARNIIPSLAVGGHITAAIPMCSNLEKIGYVDDIVAHISYHLEKKMPEHYAVSMISLQG